MHGWYYLPLSQKPSTSDWWKMNHEEREKILGPDLSLDVWVTEEEAGFGLRMKVNGVTDAPFRVEIAVMGASVVINDYFDYLVELSITTGEIRKKYFCRNMLTYRFS